MKNRLFFLSALFFLSISLSGCGYTTHSLLPAHIKKIHIANFKNSINITQESTDRNIYKTYRARLELDITKAIIDKFIMDGNLKISSAEDADLVLTGELLDFDREPLRYDEADNVQQYRMVLLVSVTLKDVAQNKIMWQFGSFAGSHDYYTFGSQSQSDDSAVNDAMDDLARRIVEQTIEIW
ncbi:MAG: LptE family protein [Candidatus Omnitrophica bacterium]|nr:LptE family protein [Candidatus Omnitrophota bacterium]